MFNRKQKVTTAAEQTRPGRVFTPVTDIFETDLEITLLADMPGVAVEDVNIDLKDGIITLIGEAKPREVADVTVLLSEYQTGKYYRQFTLSEVIDQDKIEAKLEDGVLRLSLPKAERALPKQINVHAG